MRYQNASLLCNHYTANSKKNQELQASFHALYHPFIKNKHLYIIVQKIIFKYLKNFYGVSTLLDTPYGIMLAQRVRDRKTSQTQK